MNIVVDQVMVDAEAAFSPFGQLKLMDGRRISAADLAQADVLLVRSVTRVDRSLLEGSPVRFVGTATAGTDHIDIDYLEARGIRFAAAPGCNARAVGEFVLACALAYAARRGARPDELSCGLVGCGHAGSAAEALLRTAGFHCLRHDPLRAAAEGDAGFSDLDTTLKADIVSLHVPLTADGPHPTAGMLGPRALATLRIGALLINAARGGVVDEAAWGQAMESGRLLGAVDCWQGEPRVSPALMAMAWIATPHIAGHSVDARRRGTAQVRSALAAWLGESPAADFPPVPPAAPVVLKSLHGLSALGAAVERCVSPLAQTAVFKSLAGADPGTAAATFDQLRARFGVRREFMAQPVALQDADPDTAALLKRFGFPVGAL